ncbi:MAG: TRAP transporter large permease [Alphaproteobacteria bacterium]|nr:TRAP transporter large permease [Alphaproteobacteria bacterium]MBT5158719.1 TRAP transporter large permease [Alphaproteobacteria bacterium]MBT5917066.1 TRAP transporter large permease [Alphaproteobacteria bacterium]MBT6385652.1 TRAP transporter large permease [Alphaproteobacteria bacterium]
MTEALIGFAVLLSFVFLRMPIAFAMGVVGFVGFAWLGDWNWLAATSMAGQRVITTAQNYGLSVVPLFILMGNLVSRAGLSSELYAASNAFLGHRRGGLSMATIVACGGFSAICGSSLATAATMSKVAMPPMRKYGYADSLSTASIAAGGTLGILIPPSVILVIYGLMTETSIRELFAAGFIPGMIGILFYLGAVQFVVWRNPAAGPRGDRLNWPERMIALRGVWGTLILFGVVMGGIYGGVFTPTEAAGIGAGGALLIALSRRALTWRTLFDTLAETARTSATLFTVLIGALIFSSFVNRAGLPDGLLELVNSFDVAPMVVIVLILAVYIVLGCVFESLSMLLLTIPVFFPLVETFGFHPVWFGIVVVVVTEISLITPPVGLNVFVLSGVLRDVSTSTVFKGVTPFWCADILRLALLVFVPGISLLLPNLLYH